MKTYRETFELSLAKVVLTAKGVGLPKEEFATPPWMARLFAEKLILCRSLEDVVKLVSADLKNAIAFVNSCFGLLDLVEKREARFPEALPDIPAPEVTAAGYAILKFLDEMERVYPEGLTYPPGSKELEH